MHQDRMKQMPEQFQRKPAPVIATASEAWREAIQTFFCLFAAFAERGGILSRLPRRSAPRNDSLSVFQQPARACRHLSDSQIMKCVIHRKPSSFEGIDDGTLWIARRSMEQDQGLLPLWCLP